MSELWLSSDPHFYHRGIVEKGYRPAFSTIEEMNEELIDNINGTVNPQDKLIFLGDLVMGSPWRENMDILGRIHCPIEFIGGNHDRFHRSYDKRDWKIAEYEAIYSQYGTILGQQHTISAGGFHFDLCHFPYEGDHTAEMRYPEYRPEPTGNILLHGHVHDMWQVRHSVHGMQINVGVDVWDFFPVHIDTIVSLVEDA